MPLSPVCQADKWREGTAPAPETQRNTLSDWVIVGTPSVPRHIISVLITPSFSEFHHAQCASRQAFPTNSKN